MFLSLEKLLRKKNPGSLKEWIIYIKAIVYKLFLCFWHECEKGNSASSCMEDQTPCVLIKYSAIKMEPPSFFLF